MKKLLIVSPFFPPVESVATNRIVAFAKYIGGFDVTVITLQVDGSQIKIVDEYIDGKKIKVVGIPDNSFFKKATFKKRTNKFIHNLKALYNRILLFIQLDEYDGWRKNVLAYLDKYIDRYDVVLTSFAPLSSHLIGLYIKKRDNKVFWIADMRDQMSSNIFFPHHYRRKLAKFEKLIVKEADLITAVSMPVLDDFKRIAGEVKSDCDFLEIRNGFDFEIDFTYKPNNVFTVTYAGSFYGERNPYNFLKAVEELLENNEIDDIRINFVGVLKPIEVSGKLAGKIKFLNRIPNVEAVKMMKQSDALLLIHPTTSVKGVYTGKLFEYIGALRPIIALIDPDDVAAMLIHKCNSGFVADNSDIGEIKKAIINAYDIYKGNKKFSPNLDEVNACKRMYQVEKLESYLRERLWKN
jgi:hypothetical protein